MATHNELATQVAVLKAKLEDHVKQCGERMDTLLDRLSAIRNFLITLIFTILSGVGAIAFWYLTHPNG